MKGFGGGAPIHRRPLGSVPAEVKRMGAGYTTLCRNHFGTAHFVVALFGIANFVAGPFWSRPFWRKIQEIIFFFFNFLFPIF